MGKEQMEKVRKEKEEQRIIEEQKEKEFERIKQQQIDQQKQQEKMEEERTNNQLNVSHIDIGQFNPLTRSVGTNNYPSSPSSRSESESDEGPEITKGGPDDESIVAED